MKDDSLLWLIPFLLFWGAIIWADWPFRKTKEEKLEEQRETIKSEGGYRGQFDQPQ